MQGGATMSQSQRVHHHPNLVLTQQDVLLAQSFLRLLSTVVTHSITVRLTITSHVHFRAISTLLALVPMSVPLELKGALFETLASFCLPGANSSGVEVCRNVWKEMERLELIDLTPEGLVSRLDFQASAGALCHPSPYHLPAETGVSAKVNLIWIKS